MTTPTMPRLPGYGGTGSILSLSLQIYLGKHASTIKHCFEHIWIISVIFMFYFVRLSLFQYTVFGVLRVYGVLVASITLGISLYCPLSLPNQDIVALCHLLVLGPQALLCSISILVLLYDFTTPSNKYRKRSHHCSPFYR